MKLIFDGKVIEVEHGHFEFQIGDKHFSVVEKLIPGFDSVIELYGNSDNRNMAPKLCILPMSSNHVDLDLQ